MDAALRDLTSRTAVTSSVSRQRGHDGGSASWLIFGWASPQSAAFRALRKRSRDVRRAPPADGQVRLSRETDAADPVRKLPPMLAIKKRARIRRIAGALAVAIAAGAVISELLVRSLREFWTDYPMTTALLAFGVTLALTGLVVDELVERRESRQRDFVVGVALRRLSGSAFLACAGLINSLGFDGQAERMLDAEASAQGAAELPRQARSPLLPCGFEVAVNARLDDEEDRSQLFEVIMLLTDALDDAIARWAPVMLAAPGTIEGLRLFGMMREMLCWIGTSVDDFDGSSRARLMFWCNLRVFLLLFSSFDAIRRDTLGEPVVFGTTAEAHDQVWGMPFVIQGPMIRAAKSA